METLNITNSKKNLGKSWVQWTVIQPLVLKLEGIMKEGDDLNIMIVWFAIIICDW